MSQDLFAPLEAAYASGGVPATLDALAARLRTSGHDELHSSSRRGFASLMPNAPTASITDDVSSMSFSASARPNVVTSVFTIDAAGLMTTRSSDCSASSALFFLRFFLGLSCSFTRAGLPAIT